MIISLLFMKEINILVAETTVSLGNANTETRVRIYHSLAVV